MALDDKFVITNNTVKWLKSQEDVKYAHIYNGDFLKVVHNNGCSEIWSFQSNVKRTSLSIAEIPFKFWPFNNKWPEFRCRYNRNENDPYYDLKSSYPNYSRKYLDKFKVCNIRIFLMRLAEFIYDAGDITLPPDVLEDKREKFSNRVNKLVKKAGHPRIYRGLGNSVRTHDYICHFYNIDRNDSKWNVRNIHKRLVKLYNRKCNLNIENVLRYYIKCGLVAPMVNFLRDNFDGIPIIDETYDPMIRLACDANGVDYNKGDGIRVVFEGNKGDVSLMYVCPFMTHHLKENEYLLSNGLNSIKLRIGERL